VIARARSWRRPLTFLPRRWRLTEREEMTFDTLTGVASRRLKIERNMLEHSGEGNAFRVAVLNETIKTLDSVRRRR
jgi:hypothetical protein